MLGAGGGMRSFGPPVALTMRGRGPKTGPGRCLLFGLAAVELVADKSPRMPSRWSPRGLAARAGFSSTGGYALDGWRGASLATVAALCTAWTGSWIRSAIRPRRTQLVAAVAEDALCYTLVLVAVQ